MDEDMFMVSVLEDMSDEELEAFCDVFKYELENKLQMRETEKEEIVCK